MKPFQKPLTGAEEKYYLDCLKDEDSEKAKEAKEILVERNMRLVAHVVKKYQNVNEEMDDLLAVGCIGLIKAISSFDAGKGRLATYACRCIDNEILMLLRSKKKSARDVSIYESIGQDKEGNEICLLDIIEGTEEHAADQVDRQDTIRCLMEGIEKVLSPREQLIISMRYGLNGQKEQTQLEVGEKLGISRSYVSRIEKKVLNKLKNYFENM
ncbi:MAG: RNA polymerase sporulation sigma factor SigK [Lachnospiraceae bacterium]|nr:RNA polymerase sporulation sigma factor SigK [Lachnospiraceae bacterium]